MSHHELTAEETVVENLGVRKIDSPLAGRMAAQKVERRFLSDDDRVLVNPLITGDNPISKISFERAGPRREIYFDPSKVKAAIVTCGGLCPGINSVVRAVVLELHYIYGVRNIVGARFGFQGFIPDYGHPFVDLDASFIAGTHGRGGSLLGISRGHQDPTRIVDTLEMMNINILFTIGGDGTMRGALAIKKELDNRGLKLAVVGIPKTIDNDIRFAQSTFGFATAVEAAAKVIHGAHNEAISAEGGIGLVKLMGRHSGFVAATATLAHPDVNFCLIPEADFDMEGEHGFLNALEKRIMERDHAVIVVAEGAGQKYFEDQHYGLDASGNIRLGDIGIFLKEKIEGHFAKQDIPIDLKYIDPSYTIRSLPANATDRIYCSFLGQQAAHAAMAGKTGIMVTMWHDQMVYVPMKLSARKRRQVDTRGRLWHAVLETTGQMTMINPGAG